MIFSHAALEAAVCPGRVVDALKQRHTVDGPLRAGQSFHSWQARYLRHLIATRRDIDVDAGAAIWKELAPFLSPRTEAFIGDVPVAFASTQIYPWLLAAEDVRIEEPRFFTMDREEYIWGPDVAVAFDDTLFRVTADLSFRGNTYPAPSNVVTLPEGKVLHIVDWKTNWVIDHVDSPENHRQLQRYAAALWDGTDDAVVVWLCFPRRSVWEAAVFYPDQLRSTWQTMIVAPSLLIVGGHLVDERVTGAHCLDCGLLASCDAALRYPFIAAGVVDLDEEGLVTALGVAEFVQGEIEGRLRRLLAERGPDAPIAAGERLVSITPTRSTIWDRAKTRAELKALGLSDEQADVAFSPTLGGVAEALVAAQWKNPEKGGVKRKAAEIAATMPADHGQSMDFGRKKKRAPKTKPTTDAPTESTVTFGDAGDDAVGEGVPDTESE